MTAPKQSLVLDYVPDFPRRLPLRDALRLWFRETRDLMLHTLRPVATVLPDPMRTIANPADTKPPEDVAERLAAAKNIVDAAEARLETVRGKATNLLGFVALVTPLVSWWLLSGRARLAGAPIFLELAGYLLMLLSAAFLALSLLALVRSHGVVSYPTHTPELFVDLQKGELKPHDWAAELRGQVDTWGAVQRWSDIVTDFFRAGQRFLVLSLLSGVIAVGISYLYPPPARPITLMQKATGEVMLVSEGAGGVVDPSSRWIAALWNALCFVSGVGSTLLAVWCYFRRRRSMAPAAGPERKNLVKLTAGAAAKIRGLQASSGLRYLRVSVQHTNSGLPVRKLDLDGNVNASSDYLGESEGIEIAVARDSAEFAVGILIDHTDGPPSGLFITGGQNAPNPG